MSKISLVVLSLAITACATGYNPRYRFNEVQAVNLTSATITDVSIKITGSKKTLACEEVNNFAMCADRFPRLYYPQQGIDLSWTHADGSRKSESFAPAIPVTYNASFPLRIVMEVNKNGTVKAFYEQDEPSRIYDM